MIKIRRREKSRRLILCALPTEKSTRPLIGRIPHKQAGKSAIRYIKHLKTHVIRLSASLVSNSCVTSQFLNTDKNAIGDMKHDQDKHAKPYNI